MSAVNIARAKAENVNNLFDVPCPVEILTPDASDYIKRKKSSSSTGNSRRRSLRTNSVSQNRTSPTTPATLTNLDLPPVLPPPVPVQASTQLPVKMEHAQINQPNYSSLFPTTQGFSLESPVLPSQLSELYMAQAMANGTVGSPNNLQPTFQLPTPLTVGLQNVQANQGNFMFYLPQHVPVYPQLSQTSSMQPNTFTKTEPLTGLTQAIQTEINNQTNEAAAQQRKRQRKNRLCEHEGCEKNARGRTPFCVKHGGGTRCTVTGCSKGARPHSEFCSGHGGGHRCLYSGCSRGALAKSVYCRRHGKFWRQ